MAKQIIVDVPLNTALEIHGQTVTSVKVRRPSPGELRGTNLSLIMMMNVDAMIEVLPRVTDPPIPTEVLSSMEDLADFGEICGTVVGFFDRSKVPIPGT